MASKLSKLISFKEEYRFVLEYLKTKSNASQYVIDLIVTDMKYSEEDRVKRLIREVILEEFDGLFIPPITPNKVDINEEEKRNLFSIEDDDE